MKISLRIFGGLAMAIVFAAVLFTSRAVPARQQAEAGAAIVNPAASFDVSLPLAVLAGVDDAGGEGADRIRELDVPANVLAPPADDKQGPPAAKPIVPPVISTPSGSGGRKAACRNRLELRRPR
jgi:hypothetical protein